MLKKITKLITDRKISALEIAVITLSFIFFIVNSSYVSYPDGFSNLMGALFINQGKVPYRDFFNHHLPFAWYLGSLILRITHSFVTFRLIWATIIFVLLASLGVWIRKYFNRYYLSYLFFLLLYPLVAVYFWLHLYLADSLATLFFSLIFWILMIQTIDNKIRFRAVVISSLLTFSLIFSSLTYIYVGMILYLWQVYLLRRDMKKLILYCLISVLPYLFYFIYLILTKSLYDFYFANVVYNADFYIDTPNYSKGRFFNPLKFGFTLIYNFWGKYLAKLATIKDLNLYLPINEVSILGSFILLLLLFRQRIEIGILFFLLLSFSASRGNIQEAHETDYQIGVFLMLGTISAVFSLLILLKSKIENVLLNDLRRITQALITVYLFFSFIFLAKNTYDKWYLRYTQKMPGIMDLSYTADFLDEILYKGDYYWVGPYEPHETFFVKKGRIPGRFYIMLPQYSESDYIKKNFLADFDKNHPEVVIFKTDTGIFGTPTYKFGSFLLNWMKDKYTLVKDIEGINILKSPSSFKLDSHLYILNSQKETVLEKLKKYKYIK